MFNRTDLRGWLLGALALSVCWAFARDVEPMAQPDIVLFLVDDMGWQDSGVPFWYPNNGAHPRRTPLNERYHTPHQARMATEGMLFSAAYAQPSCSSTRVSILTGMNAARHAVTNPVGRMNHLPNEGVAFEEVTEANWAVNGLQPKGTPPVGVTRNAFNLDGAFYPATAEVAYTLTRPYCCAMTLPMLLKQVGYTTILAGKAQFGAGDGFAKTDAVTPGQNPCLLGFDVNISGSHRGQASSYRAASASHYGGDIFGLDAHQMDGKMLTAALTREALAAVEAQDATKPAFLYLSHFALHTPHGDEFALHPNRKEREDPEDAFPWNANERNYCDLVEGIDASLGEVLDWAIDRKARTGREVLVIFMSDNGGLSDPTQRPGLADASANSPLKEGKGACYEGGIRVPFIVWMPQRIKGGTVCHTPIICDDVFSTILDYAGMEEVSSLDCAVTPAEASVDGQARMQQIDGISLRKLFEGEAGPEKTRPILIHYPTISRDPSKRAYQCYSVLRTGEWKLIWHHASGEKELYNVVSDVSEEKNQAKKRPALVKKLFRMMNQRLHELGAQMPQKAGVPIELSEAGNSH